MYDNIQSFQCHLEDQGVKIVNKMEINRLQQYLQEKFENKNINLKEKKDMVEVMLGDEFIGTIYRDEDEGDISYDFNMAILSIDLPPAA